MPPKGYRHISVKESIYNKLLEFARSKGLSSINDAIALLLEYSDVLSRIEAFLSSRALQPSPAPSPQAPQAPREEGVEVVKPEEKRAEVKPLEKPEKPEERKVERKKALKPKFFEEEEPKESKESKESRLKPRFFEEKPYKTLTKYYIVKFTSAHNVKKFVEEWEGKGWKAIDMEDYITLFDPSREGEAIEEVLGIANEMKLRGREEVVKKMRELLSDQSEESKAKWRALGALLAFNKLGLVYYDASSWRRVGEKERTASSNATGAVSATSAVEAKETIEKGAIGEVEPIETAEAMKTAEVAEVVEAKEMMEKTTDVMVSIWRFKKLEEELKGRLFKSFSKEEMKERGYEGVEDLKSDLAGIGWTTYDLSKLEWKNFYEYAGDLLKSGVGDYIVALSMEDRKKVAKTITSHLNERGVKGISSLIAQSLESLKKGADERDLFLSALVLKENGEIYFSNSGKWEVA